MSTPYLDRIGVRFKDDVPARVVQVLDRALALVERHVDWGEWEGKRRLPCPENPVLLTGQPIGQYHCPHCGMMVMASIPHLSPTGDTNGWLDYEVEYGQPWPPGYEEPT